MESVILYAGGRNGRRQPVVLEVDDSGGRAVIHLVRDGHDTSYHEADDLFECLNSVRRELEEDGLLLCCQGAIPNVFPSGMNRQMSSGRFAYPLRRNPPLSDADLVDVFAPAQVSEVDTLEVQRAAVLAFFRSIS